MLHTRKSQAFDAALYGKHASTLLSELGGHGTNHLTIAQTLLVLVQEGNVMIDSANC